MKRLISTFALASILSSTFAAALDDPQCDGMNATWGGTYVSPAFTPSGGFLGSCTTGVTVKGLEQNGVVILNAQETSFQGCTFPVSRFTLGSVTLTGSCTSGQISIPSANMTGGIIGNQMVLNGSYNGHFLGYSLTK